jgi:hypothetical protein
MCEVDAVLKTIGSRWNRWARRRSRQGCDGLALRRLQGLAVVFDAEMQPSQAAPALDPHLHHVICTPSDHGSRYASLKGTPTCCQALRHFAASDAPPIAWALSTVRLANSLKVASVRKRRFVHEAYQTWRA